MVNVNMKDCVNVKMDGVENIVTKKRVQKNAMHWMVVLLQVFVKVIGVNVCQVSILVEMCHHCLFLMNIFPNFIFTLSILISFSRFASNNNRLYW